MISFIRFRWYGYLKINTKNHRYHYLEKMINEFPINRYYFYMYCHNINKIMNVCLIMEQKSKPSFDLLTRFEPQRTHYYPNMPFWCLQSDGFWQLTNIENCINPIQPSREPTSKKLASCQLYGGFDEQTLQLIKTNTNIIDQLAEQILSQHFPESVQENLSNRLVFTSVDANKHRDPKFRKIVLRAYNYQCVICGYDLRHDSISIGLEAAHIK